MSALTAAQMKQTHGLVLAVVTLWFMVVCVGAASGFFAALELPWLAVIVAMTIALPTLWYARSRRLQAYVDQIGHRPLMALHMWRVPAALLFFWFGARGELPPVFWILAGVGDFIAGSLAAYLLFKPETKRRYVLFHRFGFADFVVAVSTGLTYTLLQDPRMALIATLPLALIPLFGVGVSGAVHLIAFDMLRRGTGLAGTAASHASPRNMCVAGG